MSDPQVPRSDFFATSASSDSALPPIAPHVLPSDIHRRIETLALQIQRNGGQGRITLTFSHGDVCQIDVESNIVSGECYQLL